MAEQISLAALGFVLENLKELILHCSKLISGLDEEVDKLVGDLDLMNAFVKEYAKIDTDNNAVLQHLANDVRNVVYQAEHAIEDYIICHTLQRSRGVGSRSLHLFSYVSDLREIGKRIKNARAEAKSFYQEKAPLGLMFVDGVSRGGKATELAPPLAQRPSTEVSDPTPVAVLEVSDPTPVVFAATTFAAPELTVVAANNEHTVQAEGEEENELEKSLLMELARMGFKEVDLNKGILRSNKYDLEKSLNDLCGKSEWDHILEEHHEMTTELAPPLAQRPSTEVSDPTPVAVLEVSDPTPVVFAAPELPVVAANNEHTVQAEGEEENELEKSLLMELDRMGFKEVDLNKGILRSNKYDLEKSLNDLCGESEWDHILKELHEMGFHDDVMNKKLLEKYKGSVTQVVLDLLVEAEQ